MAAGAGMASAASGSRGPSRPAGSHTASFEAIYNHKVDAGELNSEQLESAKQRGHYNDGDLVFL